MWTRRQVLVGAALAGAWGAAPLAALPPDAPPGGGVAVRVGLLQSAPPFVDLADLRGSRERAFAALRVLLERSADAHPGLDWLVAGPWALAAALPQPAAAGAAFALDPGSAEVGALRGFARQRALRVSLGAWWRGRGEPAVRRLVVVERDGSVALHPLAGRAGADPGETFAAACARLGLPGACVAPACDPAVPPHVPAPIGGGTQLLGADGRPLAVAGTQAEACVVGELFVWARCRRAMHAIHGAGALTTVIP